MLFAQQGGAGGGGGFIEILQVIFVLLFIFGPAVLKLVFGQNKNKKAADVPAAPRQAPVDAEIDEFLTRQSAERIAEKVMVRSAPAKEVTGDKRSRRARKRDAATTASPERIALSSFAATPITAPNQDALSVSVASDVTHRKHFIHPVTTLLHNPSTLMNAVVLSEVLKRPDAAQW